MAKPIILRTRADTEEASKAMLALAATVATAMGSVSAVALKAHQETGHALGGIRDQAVAAGSGLANGAMTAVKAVAALNTALQVAKVAMVAYAAAAAAGAVELYRLQDIAKKAEASNLGTTFFQAFVEQARQLRIETKALESDLAALERSTRDKFDADRAGGMSNKARDLLQERFRGTNEFGLSNAPLLFDEARNEQERIQAVLIGLRDMEAASQRLAAIDLARQLGLTNLAEQVERGRATFAGFAIEVEKTAATGIRDGSIVAPELIERAEKLRQRFEDVGHELMQNMRPILAECARLALEIGNGVAWTAEKFSWLIGIIGRAVALLRELASMIPGSIAGAQAATDERLRLGLQARLRDMGLTPLQRSGIEEQLRVVQAREAKREMGDTVSPPVDFSYTGDGTGRRSETLPSGYAPTTAPLPPRRPHTAPATSTPSGGKAAAQETDEWAKAYEKLINALEKSNAQLQAELATVGKSSVERNKAVELAKAEAEARRTGGTLTDEQRAKVLALAEAQQRLRDAIKDAETAQRAFADALQYAGDRMVDMMFNGRSLQDVLRGLAAELARAALTGQGLFAKLLGFAPGAGAPSGSVGGLLGMFGSSGGGLFGGGWTDNSFVADLFGVPSFGFAGGGWTGAGDPSAPAGTVHRGEFVFDAASTARIGVDTLETIRQARSGPPRMAEIATAAGGLSLSPTYNIDARGADQAAVDRLERALAIRDAEFEARVLEAVSEGQWRRLI